MVWRIFMAGWWTSLCFDWLCEPLQRYTRPHLPDWLHAPWLVYPCAIFGAVYWFRIAWRAQQATLRGVCVCGRTKI